MLINSRTRHFRFSSRTRTPSAQSPSIFARRLFTALWRLVLLPLCVTFPTTHTSLKMACYNKLMLWYHLHVMLVLLDQDWGSKPTPPRQKISVTSVAYWGHL